MSSESPEKQALPLALWPAAERRRVDIVLTDIDDTLTLHGRLPAAAYAALERLAAAGFKVDADHRPAGGLVRSHRADVAGRRRGRRERRVLVPLRPRAAQAGAPLPGRRGDAPRQPGRARRARRANPAPRCRAPRWPRTSSTARPTSPSTSARTCRRCPTPRWPGSSSCSRRAGCTAKVSSIHVNGWFGELRQAHHDAPAAARRRSAIDLDADAATASSSSAIRRTTSRCSRYFPTSVGVANLRRFLPRARPRPPRWLTQAEGGHGFAELADCCSTPRARVREEERRARRPRCREARARPVPAGRRPKNTTQAAPAKTTVARNTHLRPRAA